MKRILLLTMHILLPNYTNFKKKTLGKFENLVFVIMSTRENIRLIARTPLSSAASVIDALRVKCRQLLPTVQMVPQYFLSHSS